MFKFSKRKIFLAATALSFVFVFFGLGQQASAADYADVNRDGWSFYADSNDPTRVIAVLNSDPNGKIAVFSSPVAASGFEVRLTQQPDYYDTNNNQPANCKPARIVVKTSSGDTLDAVLEEDQNKGGCGESPVQYGTTNGVNVKVGIPSDIAEIAALQNNGKYPYNCPTFNQYPGTLNDANNYNCPDGVTSIQKGVKTDGLIGRTTASTLPGGDPTAGDGDELGMTDCDTKLLNPISWVMCPLIDAVFAAVRGLDSIIMQLLIVDTAKVFSSGNASLAADDPNLASSNAYYEAWSSFRAIALGLVVIASLIIIIASAFGLEILDAYTIKKALPRVFIAIVGIALSWEICEFLINLSNDIGVMVRSLIYAPFANTPSLQIDGIGKLIYAVLLTGAWFVWGPAILTFGGVALLGVTIALLILIAREMILIFCVIVAPVAIALFILPNTQKYWQLWQNTFTTLLIVFPIISGFIAMGRVFSAIAYQAGTASFYMELISFVAYFLPYFMIPLAFKMAGGIMATISGIGSDKSRGAFDRMRKMRQDTATNRKKNVMEGTDDAGTSKGLNRAMGSVYRRTALAGKGGLSLTKKGRGKYQFAEASLRSNLMEERLKAEGREPAADDEVTKMAVDGVKRNDAISRLRAKGIDSGLSPQAATASATERIDAFESGFGVTMGSSGGMLAGGYGGLTSDTSYGDGTIEENNDALLADGMKLVQAGLMTRNKMITLVKSQKSRPERANISHGDLLTATSDALAKSSATGGPARIDRATIDKLTASAVDASTSQDIMNAKPKEAEKIAIHLTSRLKETAATAHRNEDGIIDDREYLQRAATLAGIHENLTYTSPAKAASIANVMMASKIEAEGNKSVHEVLEELRTGVSKVRDGQGNKINIDGNILLDSVGTRTVKVLDQQNQPVVDARGVAKTRVIKVDKWGNEVKPQMTTARTGREAFLERKYTFGSEAGEQQAARAAQQAGYGVPPPVDPSGQGGQGGQGQGF